MDALLTSFGINVAQPADNEQGLFYRMPPTALEFRGQYLTPDYAILLLCDRLVVDIESYDRLTSKRDSPYRHVAELLRALHADQFLVLEDYSKRVSAAHSTINARVNALLHNADWSDELAESVALWSKFVQNAGAALFSESHTLLGHGVAPHTDDIDDERRFRHMLGSKLTEEHFNLDILRRELEVPALRGMPRSTPTSILRTYLTYVETNIELSRQLRVPIHDWADYGPFYRRRLANSDLQLPLDSGAAAVTRLFSVAFPEFRPSGTSSFLRILRDKRVESIRQLVADAVLGKVTFDREFAVKTLMEVIRREKRIARFRSVTSYAVLPAAYIPVVGTPAAKLAEETAGAVFQRSSRAPLDWFYLLSETEDNADEQGQAG